MKRKSLLFSVVVLVLSVVFLVVPNSRVGIRAQSDSEETEVVIVGAGVSGIFAALELTRNHPDVEFILLEQQSVITGSLPITGGGIFATDSDMHIEQGRDSNVDDLFEYLESVSETELNEDIIKNVFSLSGESFNWWLEMGLVPQEELVLSTPRSDQFYLSFPETDEISNGGTVAYQVLSEHVLGMDMDLRLESQVTELIIEDGEVRGVVVEDSENTYEIMADAVIMSTGGFANNKEMMEELAPDYVDGILAIHGGANGDGIRFVEEFGTQLVGEGTLGVYTNPEVGIAATVPFIVNTEGNRFINELDLQYRIQRELALQPGGTMFHITDSNYENIDEVIAQVEAGGYQEFESLEELAEAFDLEEESLVSEIEDYNTAVENNESPGFDLPAESAHPIKEGPFYGAQSYLMSFGTIPGIEVNENMQVLDGSGEPIPNLYASGELTAGNAFSKQYPGGGMGLSYATNSGRYAAIKVVEVLHPKLLN